MAEREHVWLTAAAAALVLTGFFGWRTVNADAELAAELPMQNLGLARLVPFALPVSDGFTVRLSSVDRVALRRDPFETTRPAGFAVAQVGSPTKPAPTPRRWNVSATVMVGAARAAIIDDVLFSVGDMLPGGATLTSVERDSVVLTDARGTAHTIVVREVEEETRDQ